MGVRQFRSIVAGLTTFSFAVAGAPASARADECVPPNGFSPCIDANSLWLPAGDAHFLSIAPALPLSPRRFAVGLGLSFIDRPVLLHAASPDLEGRDINVVRDAIDSALLLAASVTRRVEVTATIAAVLYQRGAGVEGITTQNALPIATTVLRDPRLGAGWSVIEHRPLGFAAKARLDLSLPLGNERQFAGDASFVGAPGIALELVRGRVRLGSEIGVRLRRVSELAGTRVGSQASVALGVGFDVLDRSLLSLAVESWMLPSLVSQDHDLPDGTRVRDTVLAPAEWQLSARSVPIPGIAVQLGGGTALPLSSERRIAADGSSDTEHFAGVTAARWRTVLVVRYMPASN